MSVIFIVVPLATVVVLIAVLAFVISARRGQFDDLETPGLRILYDEPTAPVTRGIQTPQARANESGNTP